MPIKPLNLLLVGKQVGVLRPDATSNSTVFPVFDDCHINVLETHHQADHDTLQCASNQQSTFPGNFRSSKALMTVCSHVVTTFRSILQVTLTRPRPVSTHTAEPCSNPGSGSHLCRCNCLPCGTQRLASMYIPVSSHTHISINDIADVPNMYLTSPQTGLPSAC